MTDIHRPLAPVPRGTRRERNGDDARQQPRKRTNIGVACTACKARKLKVGSLTQQWKHTLAKILVGRGEKLTIYGTVLRRTPLPKLSKEPRRMYRRQHQR